VIKFVSDLRQLDVFFPVSSTNKSDRHDMTEILLKVALNTIKQTIASPVEQLHMMNCFVFLFNFLSRFKK
jgi:hypothetical protein